jgi:hypothetical protein
VAGRVARAPRARARVATGGNAVGAGPHLCVGAAAADTVATDRDGASDVVREEGAGMSMTSSVSGIRDLDAEFAKWAKIKEACDEAGCDYPPKMVEYFKRIARCSGGESLDYLRSQAECVSIKEAVTECSEDMVNMWVVDLSKLPKDVKAILFSNSY